MKRLRMGVAAALVAMTPVGVSAAPFSVLWWDSTPTYGNQAPNSLRQEMSDFLTNYDGGSIFSSKYVGSEVQGTLAAELATNSYDVIVFDATSQSQKFDAADLAAVQSHYSSGKKNVMFDGNLYIRSINFSPETDFPGPNGSTGGLTVNQIFALASAGGGVLVGTDHNCCQTDANQIVNALLPGASFSGITSPSTDGVFFGDLLLNGPEAIAASDVLNHWSSVPSQAVSPTGDFTDFLGDAVTLSSLVDVADIVGGPRRSFVSTSLNPGTGTTDVDDDTAGGTGGNVDPGDNGGPEVIPLPAGVWLMLTGVGALAVMRRREKA